MRPKLFGLKILNAKSPEYKLRLAKKGSTNSHKWTQISYIYTKKGGHKFTKIDTKKAVFPND